VGCKSADPGTEPNLAIKLVDVGALGACFVSRHKLKPGAKVQMLVVRPEAGVRASVDARVRWVEPYAQDGVAGHTVGVEFSKAVPGLDFGAVRVKEEPTAHAPDAQRRHRRFPLKGAELVCVKRGGIARMLGIRRNVGLQIKDLSQSGAQIRSRRKLHPGQELDLELHLSDGTEVTMGAVVRWCRRDTLSLKRSYLAGLHFHEVDSETKSWLTSAQIGLAGR
jgi:hypothetical protein